jgi:hypothetical protein
MLQSTLPWSWYTNEDFANFKNFSFSFGNKILKVGTWTHQFFMLNINKIVCKFEIYKKPNSRHTQENYEKWIKYQK